MPIKFAAVRQLRKDRRRTERNQAIRSEIKTLKKRVLVLLSERKRDEVVQLMPTVMRRFDHAVTKGIIHRNVASRTKSRFMQQLNRLQAPSSSKS